MGGVAARVFSVSELSCCISNRNHVLAPPLPDKNRNRDQDLTIENSFQNSLNCTIESSLYVCCISWNRRKRAGERYALCRAQFYVTVIF